MHAPLHFTLTLSLFLVTSHTGVMSGLDRELLTKIRCVCLVDGFDNVVSIDKQNPSFKEPVLTAYYAAPVEIDGGVAEAGDGDDDGQPSSSSSKKAGKRKRGQVASPQVSSLNVALPCFAFACHPLDRCLLGHNA